MHFGSVDNRCAVDFSSFNIPITKEQAIDILVKGYGFKEISVDLVAIAQNLVGKSSYKLEAKMTTAPHVVDCSSFTKWLYGRKGIWIPRLAIQQRTFGREVPMAQIKNSDLLFSTSRYNLYDYCAKDEVGHVGIATGKDTVVHASYKSNGIEESSFGEFFTNEYRGSRRIVENENVTTFAIPSGYHVETSDDIQWLIVKNLNSSYTHNRR